MSREHTRRVDEIRAQRSEVENHLIDEYKSGHINRREFVRNVSVRGGYRMVPEQLRRTTYRRLVHGPRSGGAQ